MWSFIKNRKAVSQAALGINRRNVELIYANNQRKDYALADDKIVTKDILDKEGIACAKTYAIIERISQIGEVYKKLDQWPCLAIKPAKGRGGGGIKILKRSADGQHWMSGGQIVTQTQIFQHFANILAGVYSLGGPDRVLIEYCIEPHPFFHQIYPAGVPDFRVILLKQVPIIAMLRVPTDRSDGKANLHQGGLGIGIDMEKGLLNLGYDGQAYYEVHPDNQQPIAGQVIPQWEAILSLSEATSKAFPLDYLGVDIVLDATLGPLIMEVNVRPGLGIQMVNQKGMQELFKEHPEFSTVLS